ncbi:MAG: DUF2804 domain-containing protein [Mycoplasmataceae bacterium]|jgi:hypothetical protein|nr:DUF2804 domain-containing protein [Mycoplasmataceae bacterium]
MVKLVDKDTNKVNYGVHDEKIEFNWHDYTLHNFWDKRVSKLKKKIGFHKFHFVSFVTSEFVIGLAFVDVATVKNVFGYVYRISEGLIANWQKTIFNHTIKFTDDFDFNKIEHSSKNCHFLIQSNIDEGNIKGTFNFKNMISLEYQVELNLANKPLRVVNPIDFDHWSFTEKRAGLKVELINLKINNEPIFLKPSEILAAIDWSGGYFRRATNWAWSSGSTKFQNHLIGFNFTIFHNNALYPENAIWIDNDREHIRDILFKYDYANPYKGKIEIYTPDERIHLYFEPLGQKSDVKSRGLGLIKTNFHHFFGIYNGHITYNNQKINLPKFLGFFEMHKALW